MENGLAGEAYAALIKERLDEERARKESLERRGVGVITTSGALVTLLFGFATWATAQEGFGIPAAFPFLLIAALAVFVLAAALGIATNFPGSYAEADIEDLRKFCTDEVDRRALVQGPRRRALPQSGEHGDGHPPTAVVEFRGG